MCVYYSNNAKNRPSIVDPKMKKNLNENCGMTKFAKWKNCKMENFKMGNVKMVNWNMKKENELECQMFGN